MEVLGGLVAIVVGLIFLWMGVVQWQGHDFTEHHPYLHLGRLYLFAPMGAAACVLFGVGRILHEVLPAASVVPSVFGILAMGFSLLMLLFLTVLPGKPRPAWQKRQIAWLAAEKAAGRRTRWSERPDELRFGPGTTDAWMERWLGRPLRRWREGLIPLHRTGQVLRDGHAGDVIAERDARPGEIAAAEADARDEPEGPAPDPDPDR